MVASHGTGRSLQTETASRSDRGAQVDAESALVELFRRVAGSVPAYQAFLRGHGVDPAAVGTAAEVRSLPVLTKDNYLRAYPLPALCRGGRLVAGDLVAVSSGSTGQPTFWPRSAADEVGVIDRFEQVFRDALGAAERSTLAVVCFPLGTWVGGLYTLSCVRQLAARGYPIIAVAPGNNKAEILRVVPELGRHVDQVVLLGYPPFVKDVIDSGLAAGIDWPRYSIKLVLAGEVFSEQWRDLVAARAGMSRPCFDSASLYGTADASLYGVDSPIPRPRPGWIRDVKLPSDLGEFHGPAAGVVRLPLRIYWSGPNPENVEWDLADDADCRGFYEILLREGNLDDQRELINSATLVRLWNMLYLPSHIRQAWQPLIDAARQAV
jgi:phenylacetate-coenzyme A ligase PaaK-like adenylate-forming protein